MVRHLQGGERGRPPLGLIGMLALVVLVESSFHRHDADFSSLSAANWNFPGRAARMPAARCEILCLGDSIAKYGLQPLVIERQTGKTSFNLGICAGQMASSYFVLRRALDEGARPRALVIHQLSGPSVPGASENAGLATLVRYWPELLDVREALDLSWNYRDADFLAAMALSFTLPSYKARHEIRGAIRAALQGGIASSRESIVAAWRNWRRNRGAMASPSDPAIQALAAPTPPVARDAPRTDIPRDQFRPMRVHSDYALRLLELAAEHGITVFWVLAPQMPETEMALDQSGVSTFCTMFARFVQAHHPDVVVIDGRRSGYGRKQFMADGVHLDIRGACRFSADVAAVVRDHLAAPSGGPRWVELPDYQEPPELLPEDFLQSVLAVRDQAGRVSR